MIDFVGKRQWFFLISWILVVIGIISLVISQIQIKSPLQLGIDFTGGTSMVLQFSPIDSHEVSWRDFQGQLRQEMAELGYDEARIQDAGEGNFIIYTREITSDEAKDLAGELGTELDSQVEIIDYYLVSGTVAGKTARNAVIAVIIAAVAMLFYIVWAFRRMPSPFRWGTCAIIALIHDVFIIVGIFSILGWLAGVAIDALFITGLLAVVGYSINNTVVVFDRIRENVSRHISPDFAETVNDSLIETLGRCLNTAMTTLFVLLALFLFGGATIHYFVLVLLLGVIIGTYSSICISSQLLVVWEKREWRALLPFTKRTA
ncbi:MAG: protein translocase subunit SecF [Chloroflexota bacterium]|nr:protein translocase subunit SecF [Chloroflexota bacterium]